MIEPKGITPELRAKWKHRAEYCADHVSKSNEWQVGFIDSISAQLQEGRDLSLRQSFKLSEIYHEVE